MVAMRVGDENMGDGLAAHGIEQCRDVGVVFGTGVDDRDLAAADNVTNRSFEGERPGIVGDNGAHARCHLFDPARDKIEALVVGDVVAHAGLRGGRRCVTPADIVGRSTLGKVGA